MHPHICALRGQAALQARSVSPSRRISLQLKCSLCSMCLRGPPKRNQYKQSKSHHPGPSRRNLKEHSHICLKLCLCDAFLLLTGRVCPWQSLRQLKRSGDCK